LVDAISARPVAAERQFTFAIRGVDARVRGASNIVNPRFHPVVADALLDDIGLPDLDFVGIDVGRVSRVSDVIDLQTLAHVERVDDVRLARIGGLDGVDLGVGCDIDLGVADTDTMLVRDAAWPACQREYHEYEFSNSQAEPLRVGINKHQ